MSNFRIDFWKDAEGNFTVPVLLAAVDLVYRLEMRGIALRTADDAADIIANPSALLTDDDRRAIKRLKPHVWHVVHYTPPEVM